MQDLSNFERECIFIFSNYVEVYIISWKLSTYMENFQSALISNHSFHTFHNISSITICNVLRHLILIQTFKQILQTLILELLNGNFLFQSSRL